MNKYSYFALTIAALACFGTGFAAGLESRRAEAVDAEAVAAKIERAVSEREAELNAQRNAELMALHERDIREAERKALAAYELADYRFFKGDAEAY